MARSRRPARNSKIFEPHLPGTASDKLSKPSQAARGGTVGKLEAEEIRQAVLDNYRQVAQKGATGCAPSTSCCGGGEVVSLQLGYSQQEVASVPEGANLGLGCGNPHAIAALRPGETVLDLGSGGGFDCFLAARQVGESGRVIGVDMTPEMVAKARANARKGGYSQVEFRLGEIEHLPVPDRSVDVILSNCVINLSPDKPRVFAEAFRVLKPGGRLAISDVVASIPLPEEFRNNPALLAGCVGGAVTVKEVEAMLLASGFEHIQIRPKDESREFIRDWAPGQRIEDYVVSATIEAVRPII
ncbi:MAG: arsenite methyltransferase [Acidobacteria bacterium]|nr:arsenite methyltransferase [Acidobacteriota bacterium]